MITQSGQELLSKRLEDLKELEQLCTAGPDNVLGNACYFRCNPNFIGAWIKEEEVLEVRCCVPLCWHLTVLCDCVKGGQESTTAATAAAPALHLPASGHVCPAVA